MFGQRRPTSKTAANVGKRNGERSLPTSDHFTKSQIFVLLDFFFGTRGCSIKHYSCLMHRFRSKIPSGLIKEEWREEQALKVWQQKILMKVESVFMRANVCN
jgi:hypothetical protein